MVNFRAINLNDLKNENEIKIEEVYKMKTTNEDDFEMKMTLE